jgi:DNA-binding IclR family transcriptional regulator
MCLLVAMAKRKRLQPLTPRGHEIVSFVINTVALGTHDNEAEIGAMVKTMGLKLVSMKRMVTKLQEQGWITIKNDFVYPTPEALRWQNPDLSENAAERLVRTLR